MVILKYADRDQRIANFQIGKESREDDPLIDFPMRYIPNLAELQILRIDKKFTDDTNSQS